MKRIQDHVYWLSHKLYSALQSIPKTMKRYTQLHTASTNIPSGAWAKTINGRPTCINPVRKLVPKIANKQRVLSEADGLKAETLPWAMTETVGIVSSVDWHYKDAPFSSTPSLWHWLPHVYFNSVTTDFSLRPKQMSLICLEETTEEAAC